MPAALAASPLAQGLARPASGVGAQPACSAVDRAFGDSDRERTGEVLLRGYLDSGLSHEQVADQLHLSGDLLSPPAVETERLVELLTSDAG
jgi:hypothetical protein